MSIFSFTVDRVWPDRRTPPENSQKNNRRVSTQIPRGANGPAGAFKEGPDRPGTITAEPPASPSTPSLPISGAPGTVDARRIQGALDAIVLRGAYYTSLGIGVLFLIFAPVDYVSLPPPADRLVPLLDVAMSALLLGIFALIRARWLHARDSHAALALIIAAAVTNGGFNIALTHDPTQSFSTILVNLALGLLLLSWAWFLPLLAFSCAVWTGVVLRIGFTDTWLQYAMVVAASAAIGVATHAVRLNTYRRLERLRLQNESQKGGLASVADQARVAMREAQLGQERFRQLAGASFEGVCIHAGGQIQDTNDALAALLGHASADLVGRPVLDLFDLESRPRVASRLETNVGEPIEANAACKDGRLVAVEVRSKGLSTPMGRSWVLAVRDLTDRRRAEAASRLAVERLVEIERLKEVNQFKTRFINSVSHELNTPLTPITLQIHMLRQQLGPQKDQPLSRSLDIIERNMMRLTRLVGDVLEVARLQSGTFPLAPRKIDVNEVVTRAVEAHRVDADAAQVSLRNSLPAPAWAYADPERLAQVLDHLLNNAIKFTPPQGAVIVEIRGDANSVVVRVRDTGIGIAPAEQARLFQPFSPLGDPDRPSKGGAGLGLYLARTLVELHGGQIWFEPATPGPGSVLAFRIPNGP